MNNYIDVNVHQGRGYQDQELQQLFSQSVQSSPSRSSSYGIFESTAVAPAVAANSMIFSSRDFSFISTSSGTNTLGLISPRAEKPTSTISSNSDKSFCDFKSPCVIGRCGVTSRLMAASGCETSSMTRRVDSAVDSSSTVSSSSLLSSSSSSTTSIFGLYGVCSKLRG